MSIRRTIFVLVFLGLVIWIYAVTARPVYTEHVLKASPPEYTPPLEEATSTIAYVAYASPLFTDIPVPPDEVRSYFYTFAAQYGISEQLLTAISWCESRYNVSAKNTNTNGTSDRGLMQINDVHLAELSRLGLDRDVPSDNVQFGALLISRNGTRDYASSAKCWRPMANYTAI